MKIRIILSFIAILALGTGNLWAATPININEVTAQELAGAGIPSVAIGRAKAIVEYRTTHGPFRSIEDLRQVHGIGPKILEKLRPYLQFGAMVATVSPPKAEPVSAVMQPSGKPIGNGLHH